MPNCTNNVHKVTKLVDKVTVSSLVHKMKTQNLNQQRMRRGQVCARSIMGHGTGTLILSTPSVVTMTDVSKSCACPEPDLIQKHLQENTDFSGQISTEDRVCYACYRSHLFIFESYCTQHRF